MEKLQKEIRDRRISYFEDAKNAALNSVMAKEEDQRIKFEMDAKIKFAKGEAVEAVEYLINAHAVAT